MDITTMGERIKELRKNAGMTQEELGNKIGVTAQAVSKWECGGGFPEVSLILPLCDELGVTANELLSGKRLTDTEYKKNAEENIAEEIEVSEEIKNDETTEE